MKKIIGLLLIVFISFSPLLAFQKTYAVDAEDTSVKGITMGSKCMTNGQCGLKIYDLIGVRQSVETEGQESTSPTLFVQDILLSATFFIGTVVTLGIVVSGLMYIFAAASGKEPSKAKNGLKYSVIGLLLVVCSYSIIRLVQYIAKGV